MKKKFGVLLLGLILTIYIVITVANLQINKIIIEEEIPSEKSNVEIGQGENGAEITKPEQEPLTYEAYFSVERPFDREGSPLVDDCFACVYSAEENRLSVTNQKTDVTTTPVEEEVVNFWRFGDALYIQGANTGLIKYDLSSGASEILYEDAKITSLYCSPDVAFFIRDSAVHRFYIPSRVDEIVFEDEGITRCEPLSNQTLLITKYNPEYIQYAAGTGDWSNAPNFPEYLWFVYDISSGEIIPYDIKTELPME